MRLAILGSVALPVPPPFQGGTEWIAYYQAQGLAKRGHEVILFAAKGSKEGKYKLIEVGGGDTVMGTGKTSVILGSSDLIGRTPESQPDSGRASACQNDKLVESSRKLRLENVYLSQVIQQLIDHRNEYDLILNNMRGEAVFIPVAKMLNKPFINVMHLPFFPELAELFKQYNTPIITISSAQRKDFPDLNYLATVNNCVDIEKFKPDVILSEAKNLIHNSSFGGDPSPDLRRDQDDIGSGYLLMMGSITPHKNQAGAIRVAKKLGMDLVLAGKIGDGKYFEEIKKDIDGVNIQWVGEIGFETKLKLYQGAKAFIFPILWEEPFGLVMIEAMACGTPVVAFGNGAIPEVLVDGFTGFVIESEIKGKGERVHPEGSPRRGKGKELIIKETGIEGLVMAIQKINLMTDEGYLKMRQSCRRHVEEKFTVEKMIENYEEALEKMLSNFK